LQKAGFRAKAKGRVHRVLLYVSTLIRWYEGTIVTVVGLDADSISMAVALDGRLEANE
jgi:hypothetical protein